MVDGSGHIATEVFDIGAQPDNMRSIPWTKVTKARWISFNYTMKCHCCWLKGGLLTADFMQIFITSSRFNVLAVLALYPSLLLLGHLHHPLLKYKWPLLSLCFTLSLESSSYVSLSTSFRYQFLYSSLTYSYTSITFSFDSPLCSSVTPSLFPFWLKTTCGATIGAGALGIIVPLCKGGGTEVGSTHVTKSIFYTFIQ